MEKGEGGLWRVAKSDVGSYGNDMVGKTIPMSFYGGGRKVFFYLGWEK